MIDLRLLRTDLPAVVSGLERRGADPEPVRGVAELDRQQREVATRRDEIRAEVKRISREVGRLRSAGDLDAAEAGMAASRSLGDEEKTLAARAEDLAAEIRDILLVTPNLPDPETPDGSGPEDNVIKLIADPSGPVFGGADLFVHSRSPHTVSRPPAELAAVEAAFADHQRVPHWDVGADLGILDMERAAKLSGAMFAMYRGAGARLARALVQYGLDRNGDAFEEIRPPTIVRTETMVATGHLPKFSDDAYAIERDNLWATPTGEVPLTSLGRDEIVSESDLPVRLMTHTSCFRREAGAAGADTRGLLRVHEFDKVEILAYCTPDQADAMHRELVHRAERSIADLGLTYRFLDLCAPDLGGSARRCFDLEVYAPGCDRWLECSSISWFGDYQARRANLRYRPAEGGGTEFLHTLNGSALAVPRVWAAVVETNRNRDGSITIPEVLRDYMRADVIPAG